NLSGLPHAPSDAFCRLATGASFGLRQLYTDADEVLFPAARPILLNGIEDVISRPDLADRAIFLTLPPIADRRRRSERQLWRDFEEARPRILGSLLDAAAHGLRNLPGIHLKQLPGWRTSRCGPRHAKQRSGRPARSRGRIRQTAGP